MRDTQKRTKTTSAQTTAVGKIYSTSLAIASAFSITSSMGPTM